MSHPVFVEVGCTDDAAVRAGFDAMNVAVGTDFAAAGFFRHANDCCERAGFGADFAAETFAEAALDARTATRARPGKNRHRRGEWMPTELARSSFENNSTGLHRKGGHWVRLGARRIERTSACQT